ncbi:MAG: flotillin family protein [Synechococcaceae cyanobacterium SM2_3_2]|nr:flotillin family protein [Synechococcaceae cyanobacterium SM2_3_2]
MRFWLLLILMLPSPTLAQAASSSQDSDLFLGSKPFEAEPESIATESILVAQSPGIPLAQASSSPLAFFATVAGALVGLLLIAIWVYTRVYVITPNNEAFVRTGGVFVKGKTVILNGGCVVLPGFHELTRVPLRELSIDVERTGKLAVRTKDYLRADMRVTFFVCINASQQDVLTAAARLSQQGKITAIDIKNALEKRADDAIRAAAKTKSLAEIDSDKLGFAQEVLNLIEPDLKKVGLTLNNIAISEVEESDTYDENNFFDAQGVRLRTETIQRSIQQKREVELTTQITMQQKELDTEKEARKLAQDNESDKLTRQLEIEAERAQREREIEESRARELASIQRNKILQDRSVEEEEIRRKLALQQSQIDADIDLDDRNTRLKIAQTQKQQEAETAEILRQQVIESARLQAQIEIAEGERLARLAQEDTIIAITNKKRDSFLADAQRAQAEEAVLSASRMEQAEREQRLALIQAEQEAQQRTISERNVIEIDAFRRKRQAEIAQEAAQTEAESIRILAQAERDRDLAVAEGIQAKLAAQNTISNATLTAQLIESIWPELVKQLPETLKALAPQPGVLGDARIYTFAGGNNGFANSMGDINKLLFSTSGLEILTTLLDEKRLGSLINQVGSLLQSNSLQNNDISPTQIPQNLSQPTTNPDLATDFSPDFPPLDPGKSSPNSI